MHILPIAALLAEVDGTQKMTGSFIAALTITGLAVVFAGLLILIAYLTLSGKIFQSLGIGQKKPEKETSAPKPALKPAASVKSAAPAPAVSAEDEDEIAAVIAAVIAAMSAEDGKAYQVRSVKPVRRAGNGRSAWAQAGLSDLTAPFSIQ